MTRETDGGGGWGGGGRLWQCSGSSSAHAINHEEWRSPLAPPITIWNLSKEIYPDNKNLTTSYLNTR